MVPIEQLAVSAYTIPTDFPESDGTIEWDSTTLILVEVKAGGQQGVGYTYGHPATASLIRETLSHMVYGQDAMALPCAWIAMVSLS